MAAQKKRFVLINPQVLRSAIDALIAAPVGSAVTVGPSTRSLDQNAKLHAICTDLAKSDMEWFGRRRDAEEWKVLLVSGHTKATKGDVDVIPGLEGELVNVRESTSRMSVARAASLITYALAFCDTHGVQLNETIKGGFYEPEERAAA